MTILIQRKGENVRMEGRGAEEKIMKRIVIKTRVSGEGSLHLDLPAGSVEADSNVQITVEALPGAAKRTLLASDLLDSGLVGIWAGRQDLGNSLEYARHLREQAQTQERGS
jgi:hypothetical protein